jgi:histidinol-phosphate phosphatase family protein
VDAVLFDRDGTLVVDVPYNGDPAAVVAMPGAAEAVRRVRAGGLRVGMVSNQSGLATGRFTRAQLDAVNARVTALVGPFDTWQVCPHAPSAGCGCRKPRPGLVLAAAAALGVRPEHCVVVGDIGADVAAAQAAGAVGVLVPTPHTRAAEVAAAPVVHPDLGSAVDWILGGRPPGVPTAPAATRASEATVEYEPAPPGRRVLVVRADSVGDVLLAGPAIRAVADRAARVLLWCGHRGRAAADLLPGVDDVLEWTVPWIDPEPAPVVGEEISALVKRLAAEDLDQAIVLTSFHQSPLPTALLLRLAGVRHIAAISDDYPGALLDVRHRGPAGVPEAERALSLTAAAGYPRPAGDDGRLRVTADLPDTGALTGPPGYVVVHPAASVPARAGPPSVLADAVTALTAAGRRVVVTGTPADAPLTAYVAGTAGTDLGGRTDLRGLAAVLAGAACAVVGNTGPAHLAAAVGTPVVSLYAPTVPYGQWGPYGVPAVRLGDPDAPCRDSRAAVCPVLGHPCLSTVAPGSIVDAVEELACAS